MTFGSYMLPPARHCRALFRRRALFGNSSLAVCSCVFSLPPADNGKPGVAKLIIPFTNPEIIGRFVFHCHVVKHEAKGRCRRSKYVLEFTVAVPFLVFVGFIYIARAAKISSPHLRQCGERVGYNVACRPKM
jgi:hypothetical protein